MSEFHGNIGVRFFPDAEVSQNRNHYCRLWLYVREMLSGESLLEARDTFLQNYLFHFPKKKFVDCEQFHIPWPTKFLSFHRHGEHWMD